MGNHIYRFRPLSAREGKPEKLPSLKTALANYRKETKAAAAAQDRVRKSRADLYEHEQERDRAAMTECTTRAVLLTVVGE